MKSHPHSNFVSSSQYVRTTTKNHLQALIHLHLVYLIPMYCSLFGHFTPCFFEQCFSFFFKSNRFFHDQAIYAYLSIFCIKSLPMAFKSQWCFISWALVLIPLNPALHFNLARIGSFRASFFLPINFYYFRHIIIRLLISQIHNYTAIITRIPPLIYPLIAIFPPTKPQFFCFVPPTPI
jgi:hypothetical protein